MPTLAERIQLLHDVYEDGRRKGAAQATLTAIEDFLRFVNRMPPSPARDQMRDWLQLNLAVLKAGDQT